jgi:hypothetical protein
MHTDQVVRFDYGSVVPWVPNYDFKAQRSVGNFPQAFSQVCLVNTALNLSEAGPPHQRMAT